MACKIPYLDDNYQGEQLKELRKKHINVVKDVIASKLFYRRDGHLQLSMDLTSNVRKQQEEFVNTIPELSVVKSNADKDILSLKVDKPIVKDGVDFVFEQSPQLETVGTKEEYSQYLDSIFPNSVVKDIVYHKSNFKFSKFEKFFGKTNKQLGFNDGDSKLGIFFTDDFSLIPNEDKLGKYIYPTVINQENPSYALYEKAEKLIDDYKNSKEGMFDTNLDKTIFFDKIKKEEIENGKDSVIEYPLFVVFEPEQVHILGNQQDIEQFKNWKSKILPNSNGAYKDDHTGVSYRKDETLKERIFNNKNRAKLKSVLENIKNNSSNINNKLLATHLLNSQSLPDIDVDLVDTKLLKGGANGLYHSAYLTKDLFKEREYIEVAQQSNFRFGNGEAVVLHEILHALSYTKLRSGSQVSQDFIKLWEYAKNTVKESHYGLKDYDEFMTELFSNGNFIRTLTKYPPSSGVKYKNLFEEIVAKILSFFGINNTTLYDEAVAVASQLLMENSVDGSLMSWSEEESVLAHLNQDNETELENNEFSEYLSKESNQEVFLKIIGDIKSKLDNYIELIQDGAIDYPSTQREIKLGELKNLKKLLSDENLEDAVTGISNVITQSVNWIDIIDKEFFGADNLLMKYKEIQDQDVSKLTDEELKNREEQIAYLSKSLNKSKHFLYLFDSLEEFHNELERSGFIAADKFNTKLRDKTLFNTELLTLGIAQDVIDSNYELLDKGNITINDLKESIINSHIDENVATIKERNDFKLQLDEVFNKNVSKTFNAQMSHSLQKADNIKKNIKDLHYKVTTEWLYPDYNRIQTELKLTDKDILYLSKEHFTALLKIADGNENIIANWLEATIQSKDPLVSTLANKVAKAINTGHQTSFKDATEITEARDKSGFNKLSQKDREKEYSEMTNMITVLAEDNFGKPIEIEMSDERDGIILNTQHGDRKYLTKKVTAWKTGKHISLAAAQKKLINSLLYQNKEGEKGLLNDILEKAIDSDGNLTPQLLNSYLASKTGFELSMSLRQSLFVTNIDGNVTNPAKFKVKIASLKGKELEQFIKEKVKAVAFKKLYFDKVEKAKSGEDILQLLKFNGVDYKDVSKDGISYILDNTSSSSDIDSFKFKLNNDYINKSSMLSIVDENGSTLYGYMTNTGKFKFSKKEDIIYSEVSSFYYKKIDFVDLTDAYKLPTYKGKYKDYFDVLYSKYQEKNKSLGYKRLKHGIVAQVEATGVNLKDVPSEAKDLLERIYQWFKDSYKHIKEAWVDLDKSETENEDEKKSFEQQYLNGEKVRNISIKYTSILEDQNKLEKDLSVSLLGYASMVNTYQSLKQYDGQIQLARTVIAGDTLLGIERRQAKKRDSKGNVIGRLKGGINNAFAKEMADNLNQKIIEFIDDMVYGEGEYAQFDLGIFNSKQFEKAATGITAYSSLAFNVIGALGNISNGKVSTYLEAVQGDYFDVPTWRKAEYEYGKNMALHFKDYKETDLHKKSKIGQLAMMLDAIQGEYLDSFDDQLRMKRFSDIPNTALFFTQSAPEHYIQLVNMIAMLMANKDSKGVSLWDKLEYKEGEAIKVSTELQKELLKFQGTLHSVNKRLNGAYSKIDKSRLQRRWFGRLTLAFRKYIYQMFKARFGDERLDMESEQLVRGYVTSYYKELLSDIQSNRTFAYKALKIGKQVGTDTKRFALGTANMLTGGMLGKAVNINKLMGIDSLDNRRRKEAQRYIAEVSLYTSFTFIGILLGAMTSDDDDEDKALKLLELLAKRQKADMGAFLPTMVNVPTGNVIPGFASWDFTRRLVSSPIPAMRVYDNSVSLLNQLVGVEYTEDGVDWAINDRYKKSGAGYEKGDLKIKKLAQKSIIAPYWQLLKLANADQQLQYLEMVNKNSK